MAFNMSLMQDWGDAQYVTFPGTERAELCPGAGSHVPLPHFLPLPLMPERSRVFKDRVHFLL